MACHESSRASDQGDRSKSKSKTITPFDCSLRSLAQGTIRLASQLNVASGERASDFSVRRMACHESSRASDQGDRSESKSKTITPFDCSLRSLAQGTIRLASQLNVASGERASDFSVRRMACHESSRASDQGDRSESKSKTMTPFDCSLRSFAQGTIRLASQLNVASGERASDFSVRRMACHERAKRVEWWRRGESNPRPKVFHQYDYMLSRCFDLAPSSPQRLGLAELSGLDLSLIPSGRRIGPSH